MGRAIRLQRRLGSGPRAGGKEKAPMSSGRHVRGFLNWAKVELGPHRTLGLATSRSLGHRAAGLDFLFFSSSLDPILEQTIYFFSKFFNSYKLNKNIVKS